MKNMGNRSDSFKIKCIAAVVVCIVSFAPLSSAFNRNNGMIPIVMAKDTLCFVGGVVDPVRVQNMVDASIIEYTGIIGDMPLAYQCVFPMVAADTKILIKYNPNAPATTREPMINALKTGLCSMLEGNFPEANITVIGEDYGAFGPDTIVIDTTVLVTDSLGNVIDTIPGENLKYAIKDAYSNTDYIIYCASAWGTDIGCGVDMNFTLQLTSIEGCGGATIEDMYPYFHDTCDMSLSFLNYHPVFNGDNGKTCLYMMDLLSYSGNGTDIGVGNRIYTTSNITVSDWKGIRFLKDSVDAITAEQEHQAQLVCTLSCAPYIDLGVVNEGQMYEIHVACPTFNVVSQGNALAKNVKVITNPAYTVFSYPKETAEQAIISIFDIHGREIWSHRSTKQAVLWRNGKISSGVYLYQIKIGKDNITGKTTIKH